jgi:hypothetical protein
MTEVVHDREAGPTDPAPEPAVRSALVSTRRLALLFPSPELDGSGRPLSSAVDRLAARLRHRCRLATCRLWFLGRRLEPIRAAWVALRLRLRLALMRLRHGRSLRR